MADWAATIIAKLRTVTLARAAGLRAESGRETRTSFGFPDCDWIK